MTEITKKAFASHRPNGIHLRFPNGNSLSTIWGLGTYSDNYDLESPDGDTLNVYSSVIKEGSDTCETMPSCGDMVKKLLDATFPDETNGGVFGHMTFEKWLKMVNILNENK